MQRCLHLRADIPRPDRPPEFEDDVCFSESLVEAVMLEFTREGDLVLDPFAGFGTTLVVAERLKRRAVGVELLDDRASLIRSRVSADSRVVTADARALARLDLEPVDLVLTSPPFMTASDHPQNPLTGYKTMDGEYGQYLVELRDIFSAAGALLKPNGRIVVNVANIRSPHVTTLAWDVGRELARVLRFIQDVVLCWDVDQNWITNDYLLVFGR